MIARTETGRRLPLPPWLQSERASFAPSSYNVMGARDGKRETTKTAAAFIAAVREREWPYYRPRIRLLLCAALRRKPTGGSPGGSVALTFAVPSTSATPSKAWICSFRA